MSDEYDEIRQACDDKIAAAMRRVAELKAQLEAAHDALRIANASADDQMFQKREAQAQRDKLVAAFAHLLRNVEQQKNEYICKCGLRIEPHRCKTGEEF